MKNSIVASLIVAPALSISAASFAAGPSSNDTVLSAAQMDLITAGGSQQNSTGQYQFGNVNVSPAVGVQILTYDSTNTTSGGNVSQENGHRSVSASGPTNRNGSSSQQNSTTQYQAGNVNVSPAIGIQVLTYDSANNTSGGGISQRTTAVQLKL